MKRIITIIVLIFTIALTVSSAFARQRHWYSNQSNTYGWQLMTPEEQREYHLKMRTVPDYDACKEYIAEHNRKMEDRAKEKEVNLPVIQTNPCDIMKNRRMFR